MAGPPAARARGVVTVVGLGPAGPEHLSEATHRAVASAHAVYLRTRRHPSAAAFPEAVTFDPIYETAERFEDVYTQIVEELVAAATGAAEVGGSVVYAVPGSPMVAERSVELLLADDRVQAKIVPALSFLDLAWERLRVDPLAAGVRLVDGTRFAEEAAGSRGPLLVGQVWSGTVLSEVKLAVDADLAPMPAVTILHHLGLVDEQVREVPWDSIDRVVVPDHLTSLWIPAMAAPVAGEVVALDELARILRRECPWDREQTHASLRRHLLEESYEVLEAIDVLTEMEGRQGRDGQPDEAAAVVHLEEELGDLLFQVVFHAVLAAEAGRFTLADVARTVHAKLVARHPHVFGEVVAETPGEVARNWEVLKRSEKGRTSVVDGIPEALPALAFVAKLQQKAAGIGLVGRVRGGPGDHAVEPGRPDAEGAVGALLFEVVDHSRRIGVDPEGALRRVAAAYRRRIVEFERGRQ